MTLASSADGARAAGGQGLIGILCGLVPPLDELLHCVTAPPPQQTQSDGAPPPAPQPAANPPVVAPTPRFVDDRLLVRFRAGTTLREEDDVLRDAGVTSVETIKPLRLRVVQMPPDHRDDALAKLGGSRAVAFAERDAVVEGLSTTPNDTYWSAQWGLRHAEFPAAWDRTRGRSSVVVAILDTGVDGDVPDLENAVTGGYDALTSQSRAIDDNGHGTAVAGIVAARADNHEGIAGICWACTVLPIKVLGADGTGDTALVAEGIVHAVDAGARIISMSLGGPGDELTLDQAVAYARARGAILVAAAGNNGTSAPFYPAAIPGVVSVAATDGADHLYSWSNFGSWVDVAAPGCNPAPSSSGGYADFCGTSSAAPVVTGLIALLLSEQPSAGADAVVGAIEGTAVPIGGGVEHGRIDAEAALATLAAATTSSTSGDAAATPSTASTSTLRGRLSRKAPMRSYRRALGDSLLTAVLRFTGQRVLALSIRNAAGIAVTHVRGRSPIRLSRSLPRGAYTFAVKGRKAPARFALSLAVTPMPAGSHSKRRTHA